MEKEFAPYAEALTLKELGFDEPCFAKYYQQDGNTPFIQIGESEIEEAESAGDDVTFECDAPLYQQAFRWFREKYKIDFSIITNYAKVDSKMIKSYRVGFIIVKNNIIDSYFLRPENNKLKFIEFNTYEEAELECLKKLIEIVNG